MCLLKEDGLGRDHKPVWRNAFDDAYAIHKDRLLTLATGITGDRHAADDVMHDVFATLLNETWRLGNGTDVMGFLVVSVRNGALDVLRRRTRRRSRERIHAERSVASSDDPVRRTAQAEEAEPNR